MKLNTEPIEGCKVLHVVPTYLEKVGISENDKILEMGNLHEYTAFMEKHKAFSNSTNSSMEEDEDRNPWSGTASFDTYLELLNNGDEKVMEKIKVETDKKVISLSKQYEEVIKNYRFDVVGEFFDIGLVLTGVPESWLEPEIEQEEKVRIELLLSASFNCGVDVSTVVNGASRILAITKILEDHGVEIKMKVVNCSKEWARGHKNLYVVTNVKDFDEPINYKKVSALVSPTYLRRGVLKIMEVVGKNDVSDGYGSPIKTEALIDISDNREIDKLEKKIIWR